MAEKSGFFNSVDGDRLYNAADHAEYFANFIGNGVFPNPSSGCQVITSGDMTVALQVGFAWINGYYYHNTSNLILTLDTASGTLNRIDRIVLQYNTLSRNISVKVKTGTPASSPVATALQRDADVYELGIADIYVGKGVTAINQSNITDLRLSTIYCGMVTSLIDQVDTETLFAQYLAWFSEAKSGAETEIAALESGFSAYISGKESEYATYLAGKQTQYNTWYSNLTTTEQAEIDALEAGFQSDWDTWFATVQSALTGDVAGNLLVKINNLIIVSATEPIAPEANTFWYQVI